MKIKIIIKKTTLILGMFLLVVLVGLVHAADNKVAAQGSPDDLIVDPKCVKLQVEGIQGTCGTVCRRECVDAGQYCGISGMNCSSLPGTPPSGDNTLDYTEINAFGFDWGPPHKAWPAIIRAGFMFVFAIIGLYVLYNGFRAFYLRSTARDNAESVEQSTLILKNSLIGIAMVTGGFVVIQLVAVLFGVTTSITDFAVVPRQGRGDVGTISPEEAENGFCLIGQTATIRDGAGVECINGEWR